VPEPAIGTYAGTLAHWHDFYLAAGGAAATLVGLLFVALSLHLRTVVTQPDVKGLARVTLTDFICVLLTALFVLIPTAQPPSTGIELLAVAAVNTLRTGLTVREAFGRERTGVLHPTLLFRRFGLSLACSLGLAAVGVLFLLGQPENALGWLVSVTIALLLIALRNTWDLLVTVAESDAP
jgi:hypothetical protein